MTMDSDGWNAGPAGEGDGTTIGDTTTECRGRVVDFRLDIERDADRDDHKSPATLPLCTTSSIAPRSPS